MALPADLRIFQRSSARSQRAETAPLAPSASTTSIDQFATFLDGLSEGPAMTADIARSHVEDFLAPSLSKAAPALRSTSGTARSIDSSRSSPRKVRFPLSDGEDASSVRA
jgi:hypothetical protein